jgi:hypothetical protein
MPSPLASLHAVLTEISDVARRRFTPDAGAQMARTRAAIERTFGDAGAIGASEDAITRGLDRFRRQGHAQTFADLRYACVGCAAGLEDGWRLLEDKKLFPRLLGQVDQQSEARRFRRCYQGLLHGYFEYPGRTADNRSGRNNWGSLQRFLHQHLTRAGTATPAVPWTATLAEHRNLLTDAPCVRYSRALLEGNRAEADALRQALGISEHSWFPQELVMAQIEAAAGEGQARFCDLLPRLLAAIEPYEPLKDRALARLIAIYAEQTDRAERADLRDVAVARWGNPWMEANHPRWSRVSESARGMVAGWLNRQLIKDFFELLADEGTTDQRRLRYWLRHADEITDMWFALGPYARQRAQYDPDFKKVVARMQGRRLDLDAAGPSRNNAFIMRIGDMLIVEFGVTGNACFLHSAAAPPFPLEGASVRGNSAGLKHSSHRARLLHQDGADDGWEERFDAAIFNTPVPQPARQNTPARPVRTPSFAEARLQELAQAWNLSIQDRRPQGGALWVRTGEANSTVNATLRQWGFRYRPGRGWWRE